MDNFEIRELLIILGPLATHVLFFSSSGFISGDHQNYICAVPNRVNNNNVAINIVYIIWKNSDIEKKYVLFIAKERGCMPRQGKQSTYL